MVKYIEGTTEYVQVAALFQELSRQAWTTTILLPHLTVSSRHRGFYVCGKKFEKRYADTVSSR